jgi:hypothetical protein
MHLRTLARVDDEVRLEVNGPVTQRAILDALEARYPVRHASASPIPEILRLRGGLVSRVAGRTAAEQDRKRSRTVSRRWRYGRWIGGGRLAVSNTLPPRALHILERD